MNTTDIGTDSPASERAPQQPAVSPSPQGTTNHDIFICPTCNAFVVDPVRDEKKRKVCPQGHEVQDYVRPIVAVIVGPIAGWLLWVITWYVPSWIPSMEAVVMLFRLVVIGYMIWTTLKGVGWMLRRHPTRALGVSTFLFGLAFLIGVGVAAWRYWLQTQANQ